MPAPFDLSFSSFEVSKFHFTEIADRDFDKPPEYLAVTSFSVTDSSSKVALKQAIQMVVRIKGNPITSAEIIVDAVFDIPTRKALWEAPKIRVLLKTIMSGLVASTCRGLLIDRLAKTSLSGFIMPIVDPAGLFTLDPEEADAFKDQEAAATTPTT